jgi:uncharacterized protein (TIGR00251 family)
MPMNKYYSLGAMKKIEIKVTPNSNVEEVTEAEAEPLLIRVKEPPTKNKANKAVVRLLSKYFNANVRIVSGAKSRQKIVEIEEKEIK